MPTANASTGLTACSEIVAGVCRKTGKELPSWYLYDTLGSALFEAITHLPEYGLTRADERVVRRCAQELPKQIGSPVSVAELGSGSGRKSRWLLEAFAAEQGTVNYFPIDISGSALARCERELWGCEGVAVHGTEAAYLDGLRQVAIRRELGERLLVLFLGSTIGNFERSSAERFLRMVRDELRPGDALLLGTDLLKPVSELLRAYDDDLGVTAAFNLNLLVRLNRELDASFDLHRFRHEARFNAPAARVEMHLVSLGNQQVAIRAAGAVCEFGDGESILTERCHKYDTGELARMALTCGFEQTRQWIDPEWAFAENLWLAG